MQITPQAGPILTGPNTTDSPSQLAAKERAVTTLKALMNGTPDTAQVSNQNSVAPEEIGALSQSDRQNSTNETPTEQPDAVTKAPEEPISSQYAVLARKEKQLRLKDQQLRQREAALKTAEAPKPTFDETKYISRDALMNDTFGELAKMGLDYEKLTEKVLNGPTHDQRLQIDYVKKLEARLEALEGSTAKTSKSIEEQNANATAVARKQIRQDVTRHIAEPEYEAIRATNSGRDVADLIIRTFEKDGVLMTVEDAAREVESYLIDEALKFTKIKKVQQRMSNPTPPRNGQQQQQQMKTLTNNTSSSRQLSAKERAILAFKGQLKT